MFQNTAEAININNEDFVSANDNYCIRVQFTLIISKSVQTLKSADF